MSNTMLDRAIHFCGAAGASVPLTGELIGPGAKVELGELREALKDAQEVKCKKCVWNREMLALKEENEALEDTLRYFKKVLGSIYQETTCIATEGWIRELLDE